ncbi:MAG: hypothetical protein HY335_02810 [Deinococcus sp.]|nr:hypothetical protein [Deinococcus sp.]
MGKRGTKAPFQVLDLYPNCGTYHPGQRSVIHAQLCNHSAEPLPVTGTLQLMRLGSVVQALPVAIQLPPRSDASAEWVIPLPADDFQGYGVDLTTTAGDYTGQASTALDVVSHWALAPRYGFLSDFNPDAPDASTVARELAKFHLTCVQFYDWMYRHYQFLPPEPEFTDPLGRRLSLHTVQERIHACQQHNMAALAYGAAYGAEPEFLKTHQDWGLFDAEGKPISLAELFYAMNLTPGHPWTQHILGQYQEAARLGFDGIHLDQYGFAKESCASDGSLVNLASCFPALINSAAARVRQVRPDAGIIFNCVNNWPVHTVANTDQEAVYIEVWPPHDRYRDLAELIRRGRELAKGKQVILAAYLGFLKEPRQEQRATTGALLTSAAIAACGGFHLLVGEQRGILTEGYYVRHATMQPALYAALRRHYDFITRYQDLLADPALEDLSTSHIGGINEEFRLEGAEHSPMALPGTVWTILRRRPGQVMLHLINLRGLTDTLWNSPQPLPRPMALTLLLPRVPEVRTVSAASPEQPRLMSLATEAAGRHLRVRLPELRLWTMVLIETSS